MWPFQKHEKTPQSLPVLPMAMPWQPQAIQGRYDAAMTTVDNARHWSNADGCAYRKVHPEQFEPLSIPNRSGYLCSNTHLLGPILVILIQIPINSSSDWSPGLFGRHSHPCS